MPQRMPRHAFLGVWASGLRRTRLFDASRMVQPILRHHQPGGVALRRRVALPTATMRSAAGVVPRAASARESAKVCRPKRIGASAPCTTAPPLGGGGAVRCKCTEHSCTTAHRGALVVHVVHRMSAIFCTFDLSCEDTGGKGQRFGRSELAGPANRAPGLRLVLRLAAT